MSNRNDPGWQWDLGNPVLPYILAAFLWIAAILVQSYMPHPPIVVGVLLGGVGWMLFVYASFIAVPRLRSMSPGDKLTATFLTTLLVCILFGTYLKHTADLQQLNGTASQATSSPAPTSPPILVANSEVDLHPSGDGRWQIWANIFLVNTTPNQYYSRGYSANKVDKNSLSDTDILKILLSAKRGVEQMAAIETATPRVVIPYEVWYTSINAYRGDKRTLSAAQHQQWLQGKLAFYFYGLSVLTSENQAPIRVSYCGWGEQGIGYIPVHSCPPLGDSL